MSSPAVKNLLSLVLTISTALLFSGCIPEDEEDSETGKATATTYSLSGTVSGLEGTLKLQTAGAGELSTTDNGAFSFPESFTADSDYQVVIVSQPANQNCVVNNATGTLTADVSNVNVKCTTKMYSLGGTISGLSGALVLQNNSGPKLRLTNNGSFTFSDELAVGSDYDVTIASAPDSQQCAVSNASGVLSADTDNVNVECYSKSYSLGGTVSGLEGTLTLQNLGVSDLILTDDGSFTFSDEFSAGSDYDVTIDSAPDSQQCVVSNASGVLSTDTDNVSVECSPRTYSLGGTVSGLEGNLTLQNLWGSDLILTGDGPFTISDELPIDSYYYVTIASAPDAQQCILSNRTGRLSADVDNVNVECSAKSYSLGGAVFGLVGTLTLQNNGAFDLELTEDGFFTFGEEFPPGSDYEITVASQPENQICTVRNATGTLLNDVSSPGVSCDTIPDAPSDIKITPGERKLTLSWSRPSYAKDYHIYWATESGLTPENYASYQDGTWIQNVSDPVTVEGLTNDKNHYLIVTAVNDAAESEPSSEVIGVPKTPPPPEPTPLNDTGIYWCADGSTSELECPITGLKGQDGETGRDVTHNDDSVGAAGFNYTKLDDNGNELAADALDWSCVKDNVTGLVWEVKTTDGGLRDKGHYYSWYNTDHTANGGSPGAPDGGTCVDIDCDTESYVEAVNAAGLCGANDWRLPTDKELLSIVHNGRAEPAIDIDYFPNTRSTWPYWTSLPYYDWSYALVVNFKNGNISFKSTYPHRGGQPVRLVREAE